jgi:hypothetical protein
VLASTLLLTLVPEFSLHPCADLSLHELAQRVPTEAQVWQSGYGESPERQAFDELDYRLARGARLSLEDWKCILIDRGWLHWRERWPQGEPFAVRMHRLPFFHDGLQLELVPRVKDWKPARWAPKPGCTDSWELYEYEDYQVLGLLTAPETSIEFDLYEHLDLPPHADPRTPIGTITIHVSAVKSYEDCLPALKDKRRETEIGQLVARAVQLRPGLDRRGKTCTALTLDPETHTPGVALGLAAFLRQAGQPSVRTWGVPLGARRGFAWEAGGSHVAYMIRIPEIENVIEQMLMRAGPEHPFESVRISGQTLVLRGAPKYALRDWDATEYWAGEVEVRLEDLIRR